MNRRFETTGLLFGREQQYVDQCAHFVWRCVVVTFGMGRRLSVSISPVTMAKWSFYIVGVGYRLAVHQMRLNFSYRAYESNN